MTNSLLLRNCLNCLLLVAGTACSLPARAEDGKITDTFSDTWVAADALGRKLPVYPQVALPRPDRTVGVFYFLWHGEHIQGGPYDVSRILAKDPDALTKPNSPLWGPLHAPHHWGESIFGYYLTRDDGVLRKHAQMLGDAGVDVVVFDVTNQFTYRDDYMALLRVWSAMRQLGNRTPQVAFLTPFWSPSKVVRELWHDLYQRGAFRDLWFQWEGRPLILADPALISAGGEAEQIRRFFTFRKPQPDYFQGPTKADMWSWLEIHPQHVFRNSRGEKEQMSVGVAQNAVNGRLSALSEPGSLGRSYHHGATDRRRDAVAHGLNFAEQWDRALAEDPRFIFITGWNEWIAGRFDSFGGVTKLPVAFVDECDQERSRDIEPMRGGHGDNYFYQMVGSIRRYKGARPVPPVKPRPIAIDGRFDDWRGVEPEFRDTVGDAVDRQHRGWDPKVTYSNHTGRNDIVAAKVSYHRQRAYFYVRTQGPISPSSDPNWMLLYLDVDANAATGWLGYDFVIGRSSVGAGRRSVEHNVGGRYEWQPAGSVEYRVAGNEMEMSCPWEALGLAGPPPALDFKWADNIQQTGDWSDFTLNGDAAPNDRFNYRAVLESPQSAESPGSKAAEPIVLR